MDLAHSQQHERAEQGHERCIFSNAARTLEDAENRLSGLLHFYLAAVSAPLRYSSASRSISS